MAEYRHTLTDGNIYILRDGVKEDSSIYVPLAPANYSWLRNELAHGTTPGRVKVCSPHSVLGIKSRLSAVTAEGIHSCMVPYLAVKPSDGGFRPLEKLDTSTLHADDAEIADLFRLCDTAYTVREYTQQLLSEPIASRTDRFIDKHPLAVCTMFIGLDGPLSYLLTAICIDPRFFGETFSAEEVTGMQKFYRTGNLADIPPVGGQGSMFSYFGGARVIEDIRAGRFDILDAIVASDVSFKLNEYGVVLMGYLWAHLYSDPMAKYVLNSINGGFLHNIYVGIGDKLRKFKFTTLHRNMIAGTLTTRMTMDYIHSTWLGMCETGGTPFNPANFFTDKRLAKLYVEHMKEHARK